MRGRQDPVSTDRLDTEESVRTTKRQATCLRGAEPSSAPAKMVGALWRRQGHGAGSGTRLCPATTDGESIVATPILSSAAWAAKRAGSLPPAHLRIADQSGARQPRAVLRGLYATAGWGAGRCHAAVLEGG